MVDTKDSKIQFQYLDILRITATVFVIMLHCISMFISDKQYFGTGLWWVCNIINSFVRTGVPLFFMISGYLLLNNPKTLNIIEFYKKRFGRIIIPFFIWNIVYFIYYGFQNNKINPLYFFKELVIRGSSYHLWFVYTLIGIYLLTPFLKRIIDNCTIKQLVWFLIVITFTSTIRPFINTITPFYIFLFDPLMEGYIGFFILGYILGKFELSKKIEIYIYFGGLVGALIGIVGNRLLSSQEQINLVFNGGYQINHFLLASAFFVFTKRFKPIKTKRISNNIATLSSITYAVYLSHVLVLDVLQNNLYISNAGVCIIIYFLITLLVCFAVMLVVKRIKYFNTLLM